MWFDVSVSPQFNFNTVRAPGWFPSGLLLVTTLSRVRPQHKLESTIKDLLYIYLQNHKWKHNFRGEQRPKQQTNTKLAPNRKDYIPQQKKNKIKVQCYPNSLSNEKQEKTIFTKENGTHPLQLLWKRVFTKYTKNNGNEIDNNLSTQNQNSHCTQQASWQQQHTVANTQ